MTRGTVSRVLGALAPIFLVACSGGQGQAPSGAAAPAGTAEQQASATAR